MKKQIVNPKVVVVTRIDLPNPGAFIAQSLHSAFEFSLNHHQITKNWHDTSNYIACLEVPNELELMNLVKKLEKNNVKYSLFREPDYNNEATSICIEPGELTRKCTSNYRLAFKQQDPVVPIGRMPGRLTQEVCGFDPCQGHNNKQIKTKHHEKNEVDQIKSQSIVSFIYSKITNKFKTNKN